MSHAPLQSAIVFIEQHVALRPLVSITLADGSRVVGAVVDVDARPAIVIERTTVGVGQTLRVEIEFARVVFLKVFVPGRSARVFA
jgi:hypothetical protein